MFTLRCTRKLLDRLGSTPVLSEVEPTTLLGDWYANLLFRPRGQVVLFVNERSLLPVLVQAAPASSLLTRFPAAAIGMLLRLGAPAAIVEAETMEMADVCIGKTLSRQVLGSMNDFAYLFEGYGREPEALTDIALKLAQAPCSPLGMKRPADVVLEMLVGAK
ncbi:DUF6933 domain-containing protein [Anaeromyxobacter paludicola]|uniref:DUF6933 domain-containing protein n=1 Tax=Anaeromyxobacter paludicola TaxID=2918171 RepID=A0ABM7X8P8_9BACT|nr:hypothetical protein [Anaeromyxobacter paludicola]BDG08224.1 hypothetical protein AMPC_13370 [Anaeromyxobacter paludicola]